MGIINLLDLQTANLIAAGEVVERAASVIKELCENSIDAGAKNITIEIKNGGNSYMRVSDDGKGISDDDMPKTILRHATSKIKTGADLEAIGTLGFRGEALAAISSVARLTIISKKAAAKNGSVLEVNEEDGVIIKETGCPDGTTVIVRDLFYNVPARRKFMKKDSTEAMAVASITEKIAMSHPEIAFRLISDGETKFTTSGDGKLLSAIYGVAGRNFASQLTELSYELDGMRLRGYVSRPDAARGTRSAQSFFINNRYIRSKTITAALDEAYKSYIPSGTFPSAVLFIDTALSGVDVNVHPSKLEVRFSNERNVFDTVYYGVLSVLESGFSSKKQQEPVVVTAAEKQNSYQMPTYQPILQPQQPFQPYQPQPLQQPQSQPKPQPEQPLQPQPQFQQQTLIEQKPTTMPEISVERPAINERSDDQLDFKTRPTFNEAATDDLAPESFVAVEVKEATEEQPTEFRLVGEIFATYAIAELSDSIAIIDKHAAHERIIYEELKKSNKKYTQLLLEPIPLELSAEEKQLLLDSEAYLSEYGFKIKQSGNKLMLDGILQALTQTGNDLLSVIGVIIEELSSGAQIPIDVRADKALFAAACKAAVKSGRMLEATQLEFLVRQVLDNNAVRYCPHGRPIVRFFEKKSIAKYFERTN